MTFDQSPTKRSTFRPNHTVSAWFTKTVRQWVERSEWTGQASVCIPNTVLKSACLKFFSLKEPEPQIKSEKCRSRLLCFVWRTLLIDVLHCVAKLGRSAVFRSALVPRRELSFGPWPEEPLPDAAKIQQTLKLTAAKQDTHMHRTIFSGVITVALVGGSWTLSSQITSRYSSCSCEEARWWCKSQYRSTVVIHKFARP